VKNMEERGTKQLGDVSEKKSQLLKKSHKSLTGLRGEAGRVWVGGKAFRGHVGRENNRKAPKGGG